MKFHGAGMKNRDKKLQVMDSPGWLNMLKYYDIDVEDFNRRLRESKRLAFPGKPFFNMWIRKIRNEANMNNKIRNLTVLLCDFEIFHDMIHMKFIVLFPIFLTFPTFSILSYSCLRTSQGKSWGQSPGNSSSLAVIRISTVTT